MHKSTSCKIMKISFVLSVFSGLAACTSDFDVMKERMDVIRQEPRGRVEPPPEFTPMPTFTYAAHQLRSPFVPPVTLEDLVAADPSKKVAPDRKSTRLNSSHT